MKHLLLTLLLVLCGLPLAGAGEPFNRANNEPIMDLAASHLVMTTKDLEALAKEMKQDYNAQLRVQLLDPPCLATMTAAMKAMEPFLVVKMSTGPEKNDFYIAGYSGKHTVQIEEAWKQWERAKACWQKETP